MPGKNPKRTAEEKIPCLFVHNEKRCKTIPCRGWEYCPTHHEREAVRLAATWYSDLENERVSGTTATITLPALGKPLDEASREERAALGWLIVYTLRGLDLPAPPEGSTDELAP